MKLVMMTLASLTNSLELNPTIVADAASHFLLSLSATIPAV